MATKPVRSTADVPGLITALSGKADDSRFVGFTRLIVSDTEPSDPQEGDVWFALAANAVPTAFIPTVGSITATGCTITASTTDSDGDTLTYKYIVNPSATAAPAADSELWDTAPTLTSPQAVSGLSGVTGYIAYVLASDGNGGKVVGASATFTTADGTAPSQVTGLAAGAATSSTVPLTWSAATDNVGVTGYKVEYKLSAGSTWTIATSLVNALTYTVTGLTQNSAYDFRVSARDAAANFGTVSATVSKSTPAAADTTAPALSGTLTATAGDTQVVLDWPDATDAVGVTGYDVEYGTTTGYGSTITDPITSTATVTGLTNATLYYFRVRAYDAAGNTSGWLTATATPAVAGPLFADDFNRDDESTLTGWTNYTGVIGAKAVGNWGVVSNTARHTHSINTGYASTARPTALATVADAVISVKVAAKSSATVWAATLSLLGRWSSASSQADVTSINGFIALISTQGTLYLQKRTGNSGTIATVGDASAVAYSVGDTISLYMKGDTIRVLKNGTAVINYTDEGAKVSAAGYCAMQGNDESSLADTYFTVDDFKVEAS